MSRQNPHNYDIMVNNTWEWEVYPHTVLTKNILTYDMMPDTWFCKIKRIYIILSFNNRYPHINSWIHKYGYRNYWQWMRVPAAEYNFTLRLFLSSCMLPYFVVFLYLILSITPCSLSRIPEFINRLYCITRRDLMLILLLRCWVWLNSSILGCNRG